MAVKLIVILSLMVSVEMKRILLLPFPYASHIGELRHIGEALVDRGHDVYMYMTPTLPSLDKVHGKVKLILHEAPDPDIYSGFSQEDTDDLFMNMLTISYIQDFRQNIDGFRELCSNAISDDKSISRMKAMSFDLLIIDFFPGSRCLLVVAHKLAVPFVSVTTAYEAWLYRNPALPSFVPFNMGSGCSSEVMNFWERLKNAWTLLDWTVNPNVEYIGQEFIDRYLPDQDKGLNLNTLAGRAELFFIDTDLAIDYPRPIMPNEILIGGLTTGPAKPLQPDLEEFLSTAENGVILVSFGSFGANLPNDISEKLMKAFSVLPQKVIWRYPHSIPQGTPPNVKLMKWLPQNDILGHNNTKLFITHCGANGQFEALYHGVPMLNFPVFAEQPYNAKRTEYKGFAISMNMLSFEAKDVVRNIKLLIENDKYSKAIKRASKLYKDRPMTPTETAVYWTEHVMQFGGKHLRSHALDLRWYEYLLLDIIAFVLLLTSIILLQLATFFVYVYNKF